MVKKFTLSLNQNVINEKFHYPLLYYKVEIFGSWNDWIQGTIAKMGYEMSKNESFKFCQIVKYNSKVKLNKGTYEYKWKFSYSHKDDITKNHVVWLNDDHNIITVNDGWNTNNVIRIQ